MRIDIWRQLVHVFPAMRPEIGRLCAAALLSVCSLAAMVAFPWILKQCLDHPDTPDYRSLMVILGCLLFIRPIAEVAQSLLLEFSGISIIKRLRYSLVSRTLLYPLPFFWEHPSAELSTAVINDTAILRQLLTAGTVAGTYNLAKLVISATMMLALNYSLGCLMLFVVPIVTLLCKRLAPRISRASARVQEAVTHVSGTLQEVFRAIGELKSFGAEFNELRRYEAVAEDLELKEYELSRTRAMINAAADLLSSASLFILISYGLMLIIHHRLTAGALIAFMFYSQQMGDSINQLTSLVKEGSSAHGAASHVVTLLEAAVESPTAISPGTSSLHQPAISPEVEFRSVTFAYPKHIVFRDLTFVARPGECLVIMGPNGVGKTTVFRLLLRFINPQSGTITIGQHETCTMDPRHIRSLVAYVPQQAHMLNRSLRDNLLLAKPGASDVELTHAINATGLEPWIAGLPAGIDTFIGEDGLRLSGGQRQKVAISRAILKASEVVLFDEPTAGLDSTSVSDFKNYLGSTFRNKTVIIATHDGSLLEIADRLVVMRPGRIEAQSAIEWKGATCDAGIVMTKHDCFINRRTMTR